MLRYNCDSPREPYTKLTTAKYLWRITWRVAVCTPFGVYFTLGLSIAVPPAPTFALRFAALRWRFASAFDSASASACVEPLGGVGGVHVGMSVFARAMFEYVRGTGNISAIVAPSLRPS